MSRVVLAMSGGVDSSVAAHLLRRAGHDVVGLFMRHGAGVGGQGSGIGEERACSAGKSAANQSPSLPIVTIDKALASSLTPDPRSPAPAHKQGCCSASDADDARRVADRLDIPFYALNFDDAFAQIMDYFVDEYSAGRTPNPCVMCNNWLKFGKLLEYADTVGAEFVATGHYARLEWPGVRSQESGVRSRGSSRDIRPLVSDSRLLTPDSWPILRRGLDGGKDQSYVLFGVARDVLPRMMLPIGGYQKDEIREIAREIGLRVADKRDSQEICFVPDGDYAEFVRRRRGELDLSGEIVTVEGEVVGHHPGLEQFTVGQRKGLGVALGDPRYVVRLEPESNRVVIGTHEQLARQRFGAREANWLIDPPTAPLECSVQIRYLSRPVAATVTARGDGGLDVELHEPRAGVAPGQAVVCYDGDRVLGGGWIE